jgi:hypothetical protein
MILVPVAMTDLYHHSSGIVKDSGEPAKARLTRRTIRDMS